MSLIFVGDSASCWKIYNNLTQYEELCNRVETGTILYSASVPSLETAVEDPVLQIENKYYVAKLKVGFNEELDHIREGVIIVSSQTELDEFEDKYNHIGAHALSEDLGLRLFVTVHPTESSIEQIAREKFLNWSLDHGFEHIEIILDNLMEDYKSRDKVGLPRLMEALQSTMWSTMQKRSAASSSSSSQTAVPPSQSSTNTPITERKQETTNIEPPLPPDYVPLPNDSAEEDIDLFSAFASAIAEAKGIRDQARNGDISDEERRNRAADMAMRLMGMLNLDEDDDDGDD